MNERKFTLEIKSGPNSIVFLEGVKTLSGDQITMADYEQVIETEQFLEKLFGLRFHINVKE